MAVTLNGTSQKSMISSSSFADSAGVHRVAVSDYNFATDTGATGAYNIFTVTGNVLIHYIIGVCQTALTSGGAATIALGVSGNTAIFIASTTATALIANELWHDATPTTTVEQISQTARSFAVSNGQDVILTIGAANLTAGKINFYCRWSPLSAGATVVAA